MYAGMPASPLSWRRSSAADDEPAEPAERHDDRHGRGRARRTRRRQPEPRPVRRESLGAEHRGDDERALQDDHEERPGRRGGDRGAGPGSRTSRAPRRDGRDQRDDPADQHGDPGRPGDEREHGEHGDDAAQPPRRSEVADPAGEQVEGVDPGARQAPGVEDQPSPAASCRAGSHHGASSTGTTPRAAAGGPQTERSRIAPGTIRTRRPPDDEAEEQRRGTRRRARTRPRARGAARSATRRASGGRGRDRRSRGRHAPARGSSAATATVPKRPSPQAPLTTGTRA